MPASRIARTSLPPFAIVLLAACGGPRPLPDAAPPPPAATLPAPPAPSAERALLERSLDALGRPAAERVRAFELVLESRPTRGNWRQARRWTDSTPNPVPARLRYVVDTDGRRALFELYSVSPGEIVFNYLARYDTSGAWQVDLLRWRNGTDISRGPAPFGRGNVATHERLLPHVIVRRALALPDTALRPLSTGHGVSFPDPLTGQVVALTIDAETALPARVGAGNAETEFHDYRDVQGLRVPYRRVQLTTGQPTGEQTVVRVDLSPALDDARFAIPAGFTDPPAGTPHATRLADGVYRLDDMPGGYHSAFVVSDSGVAVLEAPQGAAFTTAALKLIAETAPGKPVTRVFVTHHHNDHVGGLDGYVAQGATLVVGAGIEEAVRRQLADSLRDRARFEPVAARRDFGGGPSRVVAIPVPNTHADGNVAYWLPASRTLFQGDLFYIPERGPVPPAFIVTEALARAVRAERLPVRDVVGVHGRTGTWAEVEESLRLRRQAQDTLTMPQAYGLAVAAIGVRDYDAALRHLGRADSLGPHHPAVQMQLARVHARAGDTTAALAALRRMIPHGFGTPLTADSALAPYLSLAAFADAAERIATSATPLLRSDTSFIVREGGLGHEGIAHARRDGRPVFYMGAMKERRARILEVDAATGSTRDFVTGVPGGFLGMTPDRQGRLWVAHTRFDPERGGDGTPRGSELHAYDLATGALVRRVSSPNDGRPHLFNDVVVAPDGRVYVSDSDANAVYVAAPGADTVSRFVAPANDFNGPNGMALSRDGARLYVAHIEGISVVRLSDGRRTRLRQPASVATSGIDGMYRCGNRLVGIQGMGRYDRVMAFRLNAAGDAITGGEVLERRHPAYGAPATGTIVNGALHYIARRRPSTVAGDSSSALVLRLPLGGCR